MIEFAHRPPPLLLAVGILAAVSWILASYRLAVSRPRGVARVLLPVTRLVAVAGIVLCLLDPQRVTRIEHQAPARLAVLLDTSRSMGIGDVSPSRLEACKAWVQSHLLPAKPTSLGVVFYRFDLDLAPLSSNSPSQAEAFLAAAPNGKGTAMADALETLLNAPDSETLTGVVLCSDGIETAGRDPLAVARLYRRKGIPIHTITFGTTNEMRDVILENLQVKRAVPNQSPAQVIVKLRGAGMAGRTVPLELNHNHSLISATNVLLTGLSQRMEMSFTPHARGFQTFEAVVPPQPGEWLTVNNRRVFGLEVVDPRINVIYMEGSPTQARQPEWKYLKDALESDPEIKVKVLYRPQQLGHQNVHTVDSDPETGDKVYHVQHPTEGYPRTLAALRQYDVVINSDIYKEAFTQEQMEGTAKLVEEYGGGFIMVGGQTSFGAGGYHTTVLDRFIPVAMETELDMNWQAFRMAVPADAFAHPLMAIGSSPAETRAIWTEKFPRLYGYNRVGRAKPGAVVLGIDPTAFGPAGPRIIIAAQQVGRGRTMAFTSDVTRAWGTDFETIWGERVNPNTPLTEFNCDSRYYRRFWINAIRWLGAGKIGASNAPVTLELSQSVCRPGEKVEATIRVLGANLQETADAIVTLTLSSENRTNRIMGTTFDPATRLYRAVVELSEPGDFRLTVAAKIGGTIRGRDQQFLSCEDTDLEMVKTQANARLLANIARVAGGAALAPDETANLQTLFANAPPVTVEIQKHPLWDKSHWLAALTGLLALEWVLRRRRGLA